MATCACTGRGLLIVCARCWAPLPGPQRAGISAPDPPVGTGNGWRNEMTVFDPEAMVAPLPPGPKPHRAGRGRTPGGADRGTRGGRTATTALGVESGDRRVGEIPADLRGRLADQDDDGPRHPALVEEGLIDLDARAADYLPGSVIAGIANAGTATVRQLLAMRSGIPSHFADPDVIYAGARGSSRPGVRPGPGAGHRARDARHECPGSRLLLFQHPLPAAGADDRGGDRRSWARSCRIESSCRRACALRRRGSSTPIRSGCRATISMAARSSTSPAPIGPARRKRRGLDDRGPDRLPLGADD